MTKDSNLIIEFNHTFMHINTFVTSWWTGNWRLHILHASTAWHEVRHVIFVNIESRTYCFITTLINTTWHEIAIVYKNVPSGGKSGTFCQAVYISIIKHTWITRDSPMFCICYHICKYDCIRYVFVFDNMTRVGFLKSDSIFNKTDNLAFCYLIAIKLFGLIYSTIKQSIWYGKLISCSTSSTHYGLLRFELL